MKNPLQKSRIPEGKAFVIQELIAPYFDVNWHFHSEYQLFVVLKGRGTRFVEIKLAFLRKGIWYLLAPICLIYGKMMRHTMTLHKDWRHME